MKSVFIILLLLFAVTIPSEQSISYYSHGEPFFSEKNETESNTSLSNMTEIIIAIIPIVVTVSVFGALFSLFSSTTYTCGKMKKKSIDYVKEIKEVIEETKVKTKSEKQILDELMKKCNATTDTYKYFKIDGVIMSKLEFIEFGKHLED